MNNIKSNEHKHAIIIIENNKNEYLQYYDERWKSFLFLNCKLVGDVENKNIIDDLVNKLHLNNNKLECKYLTDKIHKKYSECAKKEKEYHHYFYNIDIKNMPIIMKQKNFSIDNVKYSWYTLEELEQDKRIQEVNSDIVAYIKKLKITDFRG